MPVRVRPPSGAQKTIFGDARCSYGRCKHPFNSSILFTVTDYNEEYPLKYYVEHDGTIIIEFSGYIFKCRQDGGRHKSINEEEVFTFHEVEQKPKFMGLDINAFSNWVSDNLQYPEEI